MLSKIASWRHVRWSRRDVAVCAVLITIAAALRFWNLTSLGLTHFDEGAYTMTGRWLATFAREGTAFQPTFSPPLFPSLVGAAFMILGVKDYVAIIPSILTGSITVGLLYLIGSTWFGMRVGIGAALMLATAEYHLVFSRLALTDATFILLFWAALWCLFEAISTGKRHWFVAGGVVTGLCWNTKYHGFLPLAITGLWLTLRALSGERPAFRGFAIACGIAVTAYLPWAVYVQATIGYPALLRTHIEHSVGLGLFVTKPSAFVFYFSHWLATPLLVCASGGVLASLVEGRSAARFLFFTTGMFLALATTYLSFPRLVLPVVPAICLFAAYGLDAARTLRFNAPIALVAGTALTIVWTEPRDSALLAMRTDAYRQAAAYVRSADRPVISQLSSNYYFYEATPSVEMRFHTGSELEKTLWRYCGVQALCEWRLRGSTQREARVRILQAG